MVGSHIAHYQIRRQVGEGGMGVVYEAIDERDGQRVAIKVMRAEFTRSREALTRFFNEARAANLVEHPAMVRIQEHGQIADGTAYLAMEFLQGDTLSARLKRYRGPVPEAEVRRIAWQLSSGLAAAHKKSIVHRDLKPANIMLVPEADATLPERIKILDFGIAKLDTASMNLENPLTRTGAFMGTPHYMSPEQCKGTRDVDDRSDVYAMGVILFQMLTGRMPFVAEGDGAVMAMHIYEAPPKPRSLVPAITETMQDLVLQMLSKDRLSRPSMLLVTQRLEELGATRGPNPDLSVTIQDRTASGGGSEASATLMRGPSADGSAARTMMIAGTGSSKVVVPDAIGSASTSNPPSIPSTLGPVTGQLGTVTRYSRPLVAGVAGACGLVGAVILAIIMLRHPTPKPQQVQIRTARSNHPTPVDSPGPDPVPTPPVLTADSKTPETKTEPAATDPVPKAEVQVATQPVARDKKRNKRRPPKRKPKGKSALATKATAPPKSHNSVSVVD